jgi:hypothetical protein
LESLEKVNKGVLKLIEHKLSLSDPKPWKLQQIRQKPVNRYDLRAFLCLKFATV